MYFYIEDHSFTIVEMNGVYTDPTEADLYIAVARRYSIIVTTENSTEKNYSIVTAADSSLLGVVEPDLQLNHTSWLEYNSTTDHPQAVMTISDFSYLTPVDDLALIPHDRTPLFQDPDMVIKVTIIIDNLTNGARYTFFNNTYYTKPKMPILYSVLSSGDLATNPTAYGGYTHPMVLEHNQVVEIVLNNGDTCSHPFHPHGHNFQVINRYPSYADGFFNYADSDDPDTYGPANHSSFPAYPAR